MRAFVLLKSVAYMSCFVALWGWAAVAVRRYDTAIGITLPGRLAVVGYLAMACGAAVALLCGANFALRGRGTPAPFDPPLDFVAAGPYRFLRNPMYLGAAAMLAGYGLAVGSVAVLLLAAAGVALAHVCVVLVEEPGLERRFGDGYRAYRVAVNRWVPRRPAPPPSGKLLILLLLMGSGAAALAACADLSRGDSGRETRPPTPAAGPPAVEFYEAGARPQAIAVADLDGDGRRDAAVANGGDGTVTVLLGDGNGRLRRTASFAAGPDPTDIGAVDIDRDGDLDLVVANHETPNITTLANDGRGRFAPALGSPFDTGARPHVHGLATGDFDGDGWADVAVESFDTGEVRVLRGVSGGFTDVIAVPAGTRPYYRLGAGDVTGDGRPEILVPGHSDRTVRAVEGERGMFRAADWRIALRGQPWMVVAGDVDGEGHDDVAVVETDALSVWLAGPRGFAPAPGSPFAIPRATHVAIGDLDGDGAADVAVGPWDGDEVTVLHGRTAATRRVRLCERPIGLAIADLDGDGSAELLAVCRTTDRLAVASFVP